MGQQPVQNGREAIAVFGLGYVGCVTAACLASLGHRVVGVDKDDFKVRAVNEGKAPFHEPGLEGVIHRALAQGCLSATTDPSEALAATDIALLCVGTPSARNGNLSTDQLERVSTDLAALLREPRFAGKRYIVAVRSTVFPGTCEEVVIPRFAGLPVSVVANPEFLREGTAVKDFEQPSLLVVGGHERAAVERVGGVYASLPVQPCLVALRTAEMIKYACNAFHAVKIAFANEIGAVAGVLGIDGAEVMDTLCQDTVLNISKTYLKPGFAFGGSCLPKDLRALSYRAARLDLNLPLLQNTLPSNDAHLKRAIDLVLDLPATKIGVYGLSFKDDTDDVRESPVVAMLEQLVGKGKEVRVYDPNIRLDAIYGSNQNFLLTHVPHIGRLLTASVDDVIGWAEAVVVTQKVPAEVLAAIEARHLTVVRLTGANPVRAVAVGA